MKQSIELYLISGFLGAGKTTLLQNLLCKRHKKIGVLINEFSSIGMDGRTIERDNITLIEINHGSIFCSCLKGEFIKALIELSKTDIEVLYIEGSGMADPSNFHALLKVIENKLEQPYVCKGTICIVDSTNFLKHLRVLTPIHNQISSSNFIIINKTDLVNEEQLHAIELKVKEINLEAYMVRSSFSKITTQMLEEHLTVNCYNGITSNEPWNRPECCYLESDRRFTKEELIHFLQKQKTRLLRIKGYAQGIVGWYQIDATDEIIKVIDADRDLDQSFKSTRIVMIGIDPIELIPALHQLWFEMFHETPRIYDDGTICGGT